MGKAMTVCLLIILLLAGCQPQGPAINPAATAVETRAVPTQDSSMITAMPTATRLQASQTEPPAPGETTEPASPPTNTVIPPTSTVPVSASEPYVREGEAIIVDHQSLELFEQIPEEYLTAARNLRMMFSDRSVGQNINEALDCLVAESWPEARSYCRRDFTDASWNWKTFNRADFSAGSVPARILFDPDAIKYDRSSWVFEFRGGSWSQLTQDFVESLAPSYLDKADVLSYQFPYFAVDDRSDIADPETGFFADNPDRFDIFDLEAFMAGHPDKTFFLWTTSLARGVGTQNAVEFNNQMRRYALERNMILLDAADILSHTDQGAPCFDNRDGVEYCTQNGVCENYPDDGVDLVAICQDYTTETDGGHLGSVSAGKIRLAKAIWVLMARIAGWTP